MFLSKNSFRAKIFIIEQEKKMKLLLSLAVLASGQDYNTDCSTPDGTIIKSSF